MFGSVEDELEDRSAPVTLESSIPTYCLESWKYLTNALSSFCSDTPVNWATTIDLKPDALLPLACIPFIPQTERKEILKIYGDAPVTVSVSITTVAEEILP